MKELFEILKERYKKAYLGCNNREVKSIKYVSGWVILNSTSTYVSKMRISEFQRITEVLEKRLTEEK